MEAKPQLIREWYEISERRREFVIRTVKRFRQHASPNPFREVFRIHFVSQPTIVSRVTVATSAGFRVPRDYHAAFSRAAVASTTTGIESRDYSTWWKQAQVDFQAAEEDRSTSWIAYKSYQVC